MRSRATPRCARQAQIVPIVEPEVLMDGDHDIDRCYEVTQRVLNKTFQELLSSASRSKA
jgi:fructose-bisphosphate aldolase class 1